MKPIIPLPIVKSFRWYWRKGWYTTTTYSLDGFTVEITVSPTGRSKQIFVNQKKVYP